MLKLILSVTTFVFLFANQSHAAASVSFKGAGYRIEPIIGYETVYRDTPAPHTVTRTMIGGRIVLGSDLISGELEYTKGSDTENFSTAPEKIYSEDEKAKLGIRSTYRFNNYFFTTGRLGVQGTRGFTESTSSGVVTRTDHPIKYHPYAGASLGVRLGSFLSISAGSTVVFKDNSDMQKNDIQNTVAISIGVN